MYTQDNPTDIIARPDIFFGRRTQLPEVPQIEDTIVVEADTYWEQYVNSLEYQGWQEAAIKS